MWVCVTEGGEWDGAVNAALLFFFFSYEAYSPLPP